MKTDAPAAAQPKDGWFNWCRCGRRYWVRAVDIGKPAMRRFEDRESSRLHECPSVQP